MRPTHLAALLLLLVPLATGQQGGFDDTHGDAPVGMDILSTDWSADGGVQVQVTLDAARSDDTSLTVLLFFGSEGAAEPDEWYLFHTGPGGTDAHAGHTGAAYEGGLSVDGTTYTFTGERVDASGAPCAFAVAQTWTDEGIGRHVRDTAPSRDEDLAQAWAEGAYCAGLPKDDTLVIERTVTQAPGGEGEQGTPAVSGLLLVGVLLALAAARRK